MNVGVTQRRDVALFPFSFFELNHVAKRPVSKNHGENWITISVREERGETPANVGFEAGGN